MIGSWFYIVYNCRDIVDNMRPSIIEKNSIKILVEKKSNLNKYKYMSLFNYFGIIALFCFVFSF
jgi:hypothetical protein